MFVLRWNLLLALLSTWYRYWWDRNTLVLVKKKCNNEPIGTFELPVSAIWSATNTNNSHNMKGNNSRKKTTGNYSTSTRPSGKLQQTKGWVGLHLQNRLVHSLLNSSTTTVIFWGRGWFVFPEGKSTSLTCRHWSSALPLELWPRSPTILEVQLTL